MEIYRLFLPIVFVENSSENETMSLQTRSRDWRLDLSEETPFSTIKFVLFANLYVI